MTKLKFSEVTVGDVVINVRGQAMEVRYITSAKDGQIVLCNQRMLDRQQRAQGRPNDYIEVTNRCENCRQRTLAHTGECMAPICCNRSEVPDDPESQLEWVQAARSFRSSAAKMSELWLDLDERAQSVEMPEGYPWQDSFEDGPLQGILNWLSEEKLSAIEQRANSMGNCLNCGAGQMIREYDPITIITVLPGQNAKTKLEDGDDQEVYVIAACNSCDARIVE